jgi:hypothetical protein
VKERDEYDKKIDSAPGSDCAAGAAAFMQPGKGMHSDKDLAPSHMLAQNLTIEA